MPAIPAIIVPVRSDPHPQQLFNTAILSAKGILWKKKMNKKILLLCNKYRKYMF